MASLSYMCVCLCVCVTILAQRIIQTILRVVFCPNPNIPAVMTDVLIRLLIVVHSNLVMCLH